ncbi:MAG: FAD binding domain-containing protein [Rubrobacteraceae bacterium]
MKPAPFEYVAPRSLEEAVSLLEEHGFTGKILAGGQSLGPLLNMRLAFPEVLVDLNKVSELDYIKRENGHLEIGAIARQRRLEKEPGIGEGWPLLREVAPWIGHTTLRNRGTICGSIAHADPAAELPAVAVALGAEMDIAGPDGKRTSTPEEFFISYLTTDLEPEEILTSVRFPSPLPRSGSAFMEIARRHGDFALVGVAAVMTLGEDGEISGAKLVYTGVDSIPFQAKEAAGMLAGESPGEELFADVAEKASAECEPGSDIHASANYRRRLVRVLTRRAIGKALERAKGENDGAS